MQYQIIYTLFNELKYEVSNLLLNFAWNGMCLIRRREKVT